MSKLRLYSRLIRLLAVIALGTLLAALLVPMERLSHRELMGVRQRMTRWFMARLSNALPFRVSVHGQVPHKPMLWLSNHISWTDIPLIGRLAPLSFLSKAEVRTWPVAGWLAHKAGTLFIRRGAGDGGLLNQQLGRHLNSGRHLLIFPEGTTCDGTALRTFHGRLLSSAIESGIELQPVAIRYLRDGKVCTVAPFIGDDDMLSHLLRLMNSEVAEVEIQLLEPIDSQSGNRNELARRAHAAINAALYGPADSPEVAAQAA
ncbi:lysophospholipid acyltransferase family protein [Phytopseudomonas seleniipraecipitans]|uniref:Lyso-ornithine lipid acyltransferase n=1 Tax=Phytopseudomonas seleniipraecipitans TaxID=640205 RepID=A0A1G7GR45_9GAMM|nr:lysophospholipid acyltransferase family protein [Pseudomonas seleniipraecipitans]SDE90561.1 lyso-ornithine lipid acyltransferase [Pseudomonas seleniipraecipitans]